MEVENFDVPVGEIVPKLDGEFAEHMNFHATAGGIAFDEVGIMGWERGDVPKALEEFFLFPSSERPEKFKDFNVNEQTGVAY